MLPMKQLPFLVAVLAACGVTEPASDGRDDSFLTPGKGDTGGIEEGTSDARQVLQVANSLGVQDLVNVVGLATNTAEAIGAVRVGDDGIVGTADDVTFTTLRQLDDVPWVGPIAFHRLLDYARTIDDYGDAKAAATDLGTLDNDNSYDVESYAGHLAVAGDEDWFEVHLTPHSGIGDPRPALEYLDAWISGPVGQHDRLEVIVDYSDQHLNDYSTTFTIDQDAPAMQMQFPPLVYGLRSASVYFHIYSATQSSDAIRPYHAAMWLHH